MAEAAGPTQGFRPVLEAAGADVADSPFGTGPVDAVLGATLGEYATGFGEAKFAYDAATFLGAALTNAFKLLNSQQIRPVIDSGYRSPADQTRMRNGASGPNPAAVVSWHEAGMAVDIDGTASSYFPTIVRAMEAQGLTWGGTFAPRDPPHFQLAHAGTQPSAAMVASCAAAAGGHQ
ncbi:MAG: M15 family metallopeptidase [Terriglobales bacterium]